MFIGREREHPSVEPWTVAKESEKQVIIGPIKNGSDQWNERRSEWQRDDENNN